VKQFDVGDFVYLQWQPNDTLDTCFGCTILRIKVIKPLDVLELQGANERTIRDHSKNCAPCHLPNLDPTIIMLTWIPPLDYPCQVSQPHFGAKCENVTHTPKSGKVESSGTPKNSEDDLRGQISLPWRVLYINEKILKRRCPKWPRIAHLDICSPSYGQKKG